MASAPPHPAHRRRGPPVPEDPQGYQLREEAQDEIGGFHGTGLSW